MHKLMVITLNTIGLNFFIKINIILDDKFLVELIV